MPVREPMGVRFWELLSGGDLDNLHADTLAVLRDVGVEVREERARASLAAAGARVDGSRVRIDRELVERALETAPREIGVFDRTGHPAMRLSPGFAYYGTGSDVTWVIDPKTGERRRTDLDTIRMAARLGDALPNLDFVMSMGTAPQVPPELADQHHFAAMIESTTKPIVFTSQSARATRDIASICAVVAGGDDAFRTSPFAMVYAMPTAPLTHTNEALSSLLIAAETGIPAVYSAAPMMGGTGPITLVGTLIVANAEMLSGLVIQQLHRPGAGFIHGPIVGPLHMRTMVNLYAGPESVLARVAEAQLARYYKLPVFSLAGASDAKLFDQQAAAEASMSLLVAAIAGGNLIHDVGYLESGLCASPELMVFCDEIVDQVRFVLRGMDVSDGAALLGDIAQVGPGGSFLGQESTLARHRQSIWSGATIDQGVYEEWVRRGSKDTGARVRERTIELLASHTPEPLDPRVQDAIWEIARGRS